MSTIRQRTALRRAIVETVAEQGLSMGDIARAVADLAREDATAGNRGLFHALEEEVRRLREHVRALLAERDHERRLARTCEQCGRPFRGRADARTCSSACRQRASRARRAETT